MKDASWLSLLKKPYRFYHIFSTPHTLLFEKADDERQKDRFDLFLTLLRFLFHLSDPHRMILLKAKVFLWIFA